MALNFNLLILNPPKHPRHLYIPVNTAISGMKRSINVLAWARVFRSKIKPLSP